MTFPFSKGDPVIPTVGVGQVRVYLELLLWDEREVVPSGVNIPT